MKFNRLTPFQVANAKEGRHADGGGLYVQVTGDARSWLFRYTRHGKAREMGLGSVAAFTLAEARVRAKAARQQLADGLDPLEERRKALQATRLEEARAITFSQAAERYIAAHKAGWKNAKHADQWANTLETYAAPFIGNLPVAGVDTALVMQQPTGKQKTPLWTTKAETASRLRGRIERVLDWAKVQNMRSGENPARWKGHLDKLLAPRSKVAKVRHQPAMPWQDVPVYMAELRQDDCMSARALEFTILTWARTSEVIQARRSEIDWQAKTWNRPAAHMKGDDPHTVPLSDRCLEILKALPIEKGNDHLFIGATKGAGLSNMAMLEYLQGKHPDLTVHGFRSSARDWAGESTGFGHDICEMALAHRRKDKTHAAYQRGELLMKRRKLMEAWAGYCCRPAAAGKVLEFKAS